MPKVTFYSKANAELLLEEANVICLLDPGEEVSYIRKPKRHLWIKVSDIEEYIPGHTPFSYNDAKEILSFIKECGDEDIIVHCHMGFSRSAAVAKFMADKLKYTLDLAKPCYGKFDQYNGLVYGLLSQVHADTVLEYQTRLELLDRARGQPF